VNDVSGTKILVTFCCIVAATDSGAQVTRDWVAVYDGAFGDDVGLAIAVDDFGFTYITGASVGQRRSSDIVTIKYDPAGLELWAKRYSDTIPGGYVGFDIAVDISGSVFVAGDVLLKYDSTGNLLWHRFEFLRGGFAIRLDSVGNIYIGGQGDGEKFIVRKLTTDGTLLWERFYSGPGLFDILKDIVLDKEGNIIVTGQSHDSTDDPEYATVKYSNNGTFLWARRYRGAASNHFDLAYGIAADDSNNIYVTGWSNGPNETADILTIKYAPNGDTMWTARYDGVTHGADVGYDIILDSLGFVYVAGRADGGRTITLKYDRNGNLIWATPFSSGSYLEPQPVIKLDRNRNIYVSATTRRPGNFTNYAVVKYNNDGVQQWVAEYFTRFYNYIYDLEVDKLDNVYVTGTANGTTYDIATVKYSQGTTSVRFSATKDLIELKLHQNYPNPFNPTTTIRYAIPNDGLVTLKVYNIAGQEVATLVNEAKKAGKYEITFDAKNVTGSSLASGVYLYRVSVRTPSGEAIHSEGKAGNFSEVKKMVLLR
jgi:hypothetical protein